MKTLASLVQDLPLMLAPYGTITQTVGSATPGGQNQLFTVADPKYGSITLVAQLHQFQIKAQAQTSIAPEHWNETFPSIITQFDQAAEHLQWPKVRLLCESSNDHIQLVRAGIKSRYPGSVNIYFTNIHSFKDQLWLGRIHRSGRVQLNETDIVVRGMILEALTAYANDLLSAVKTYAQATNNCCFCGLALTEAFSVQHGYGPICADHWGLPHAQNGTVPEPTNSSQPTNSYKASATFKLNLRPINK